MSAARPLVAIDANPTIPALTATAIGAASVPLAPGLLVSTPRAAGLVRRTKIWEFSPNLHCSIIGTCLSTGELRQVLRKLGLAPPGNTDHELHGVAVSLAGRHDKAAKLLNKALDERHRLAIKRFSNATAEAALRALWRSAVQQGDIPGAYWATLTHPAATHAVIHDAFGDVHMLSHLVGAANRADIRRLSQLESDNAELRVCLDRQHAALHEAVVSRDASIRDLRRALTERIAAEQPIAEHDSATLRQLVAELQRRLAGAARRILVLEDRLAKADAAIAEQRAARATLERDCAALHSELDVIETTLLAAGDGGRVELPAEPRLQGVIVLYVGGRAHQVAHLRASAERLGAAFLHHDGGIEHHLGLLAGLAGQADIVVFPVGCISHHAAQAVKLLCRQTGKRFIPLRSSGATSLVAALRRPDAADLQDAAD